MDFLGFGQIFSQKRKQIVRMYLAGIYNMFDWEGFKFPHFSILTTKPNNSMTPYHNRMPVLLEPDEQEAWLQGSDVDEVLRRVPFELDVNEAS